MKQNIFIRHKSTSRLREIKNAAFAVIMNNPDRDKRLFIVDSITIHFFKDCCLVMAKFLIGQAVRNEHEMPYKTLSVYSRDLKEWKEYTDQFEPKEGYHMAHEYKPHNEPFPTREW